MLLAPMNEDAAPIFMNSVQWNWLRDRLEEWEIVPLELTGSLVNTEEAEGQKIKAQTCEKIAEAIELNLARIKDQDYIDFLAPQIQKWRDSNGFEQH